MSAKPLLDFETLVPERPFIRIDGEPYQLALLSDFGLVQQSHLARLMSTASDIERAVSEAAAASSRASTGDAATDAMLERLDAIPEKEAERVVALLDEIVGLILLAPAEVRAKLSEPQKRRLIEAFMPAVTEAAAPTPKGSRQSRSMSAGSSRVSARPTAPAVPG